MLTVTILDHNFCILSETPTKIKNLLSYQTKTYNPKNKGYRFGHESLIDFTSNSTYTGLVPLIQQNIDCKIIDQRVFPSIDLQVPELSVDLREYQIDYLEAALREKRMVVHSPTGSGKTTTMAAIMSSLNLPTLIIPPNNTIMAQLSTELARLMPKATFGTISGEGVDDDHQFVIGSVKSLIKMPAEYLRRFQLLLIDECHCSAAQQFHDVILNTNAPYRYGFTATPTGRSDNRDLVVQGLIGKVVELVEREALIDQGFLAQTDVEMYRGWWEGNFHAVEDLLIVKNDLRNKLIKNIVDKSGVASVLILVRRIEHGTALQKMFGSQSIFIHGDSSQDLREEVRRDVKAGKYRVLIASNIFGMGLDIPNLQLGIFAAGGKAEIGTGQGVGRVVRPWKDLCKVWVDIYDEYCGMLEEHSKERMSVYHKHGIPVRFIGFPPGKQRQLDKELSIQ